MHNNDVLVKKRKKSVCLPLKNAEVVSYKTEVYEKYHSVKHGSVHGKVCSIEFKDPKWGKVYITMSTKNPVCNYLRTKSSPGTIITADFKYTHHFQPSEDRPRVICGKSKAKMSLMDVKIVKHVPWHYNGDVVHKNEKIEKKQISMESMLCIGTPPGESVFQDLLDMCLPDSEK